MATEARTRIESGGDLVALGESLGFYEVMSEAPVTAAELVERSGAPPGFVRDWVAGFVGDWLAEQAREGYVVYDASAGRYANSCSLPPAA